MIVVHCLGGIVFYANKVFIVKNDRGEWTLPKGKAKDSKYKHEGAQTCVKEETGMNVNILASAGDTVYEFYSRSRKQQVCNAVTWYIMESNRQEYELNEELIEGGFYKVKDAIKLLSHNKEKSLVEISYKKFKELKKNYYEANITTTTN